jgi:hypothetical protein
MGLKVLVATALALSCRVVTAQQPLEVVARELVPLLVDVRRNIESKATVQPGTLPPSPFTGRNSTLFAIRIGFRTLEVEPKVVEAIDRLLRWDRQQPLAGEDRALVERWIESIRGKLLGRLAARGTGVGCDDDCLIRHLTEPGELFGRTRLEQRDGRNELLLDALVDAVNSA